VRIQLTTRFDCGAVSGQFDLEAEKHLLGNSCGNTATVFPFQNGFFRGVDLNSEEFTLGLFHDCFELRDVPLLGSKGRNALGEIGVEDNGSCAYTPTLAWGRLRYYLPSSSWSLSASEDLDSAGTSSGACS
jgi:hypothetical protein